MPRPVGVPSVDLSTVAQSVDYTAARAALLDRLDALAAGLVDGAISVARVAALDNLDALISSRAAGATALSTVQWTNARAALLDNLDALISSRAAGATALSTVQWTNARAALLDNLDALISSRMRRPTAFAFDAETLNNTPAANEILLDSLNLAAGDYEVIVHIERQDAASTGGNLSIVHRNAGDTADVKSRNLARDSANSMGLGTMIFYFFGVLVNESIVIRNNATAWNSSLNLGMQILSLT